MNGDSEQNPIQLCIGMMKAVIVMICFREIYVIFVGVVEEFLNSILGVMTLQSTNLSNTLLSNIQRRNIYSSCLFSITNLLADINLSVYYERH